MIGPDSSANLSGVDRLANTFSIMRHGQSMANVAGIIVSRIESDQRGDYGLSELGQAQALEAARACGLSRDTVIFSSDFSRARQTAEIVRAHLGAPEVNLSEALRERSFGDWEGSATGNYARVWAADEANSAQVGGVEPAAAVLDRTTALIADLERRYSGRHILLVSHGDTLQILQAGFLRISPARHRRLPGLQTAEIRQLRLSQRAIGNRFPHTEGAARAFLSILTSFSSPYQFRPLSCLNCPIYLVRSDKKMKRMVRTDRKMAAERFTERQEWSVGGRYTPDENHSVRLVDGWCPPGRPRPQENRRRARRKP